MAGHNKWSKIKRLKGATDAKKGKMFTKVLREIQVAAKISGVDPKNNPRLRDAIEEAKVHNIPKVNIEKAIQRGAGSFDSSTFENILYEGYAPFGVAILIDCLTDNRNRTVADIRAILSRRSGRLGESGSVVWMFDHIHIYSISKKHLLDSIKSFDHLLEDLLSVGLSDFQDVDQMLEFQCPFEHKDAVRNVFELLSVTLVQSYSCYIPKTPHDIKSENKDSIFYLIEALEELDDVQNVFSSLAEGP
jgi:YebC/PmpR family DNA-binding regulatory protein